MRVKNIFFISLKSSVAVLTICSLAQFAGAQAPAKRQAFPWSSSAATATKAASTQNATRSRTAAATAATAAAPVSSTTNFYSPQTNARQVNITDAATKAVVSYEQQITVDGETLTAEIIDGEVVYLDAATRAELAHELKGNRVAREARVTRPVTHSVNQRPQPVETSIWGKAFGKTKRLASNATSVFKKPVTFKVPSLPSGLLKTPEGLNLPSSSMPWSKPKFDQPTTWFSREVESPVTFAPLGSLPRSGQFPSSLDETRASYAAHAKSGMNRVNAVAQEVKSARDSASSVWESVSDRAASSVFEPETESQFEARR